MRSLTILILALSALGMNAPVFAQEPQQEDVFAFIFPKPTGKNGYEEWVMAGVILNRDREAAAICGESKPSLSAIRRLMQMQGVKQARAFFQAGLNKRILIPRNAQDLDENTRFPEFALFRFYARLHHHEMHLALAEGRNSDAIEALGQGLLFGYRIQKQTLIGGLVGVAIGALTMRALEGDLPTFSVRDCDALQRILEERLRWESPLASLLDSERQWMRRTLQKVKKEPNTLLALVDTISEDESDPEALRLQRDIQNNSGRMSEAMTEAEALMDSYYQATFQNLQLPAYKRKAIPEFPKTTLASRIVNLILPSIGNVANRFDRERAGMQMLAVRAALRRYHWDYGRFPARLADLRLNELAIDPFTGKPFTYRLEGGSYILKAEDGSVAN